jgi:hypothetical protein
MRLQCVAIMGLAGLALAGCGQVNPARPEAFELTPPGERVRIDELPQEPGRTSGVLVRAGAGEVVVSEGTGAERRLRLDRQTELVVSGSPAASAAELREGASVVASFEEGRALRVETFAAEDLEPPRFPWDPSSDGVGMGGERGALDGAPWDTGRAPGGSGTMRHAHTNPEGFGGTGASPHNIPGRARGDRPDEQRRSF